MYEYILIWFYIICNFFIYYKFIFFGNSLLFFIYYNFFNLFLIILFTLFMHIINKNNRESIKIRLFFIVLMILIKYIDLKYYYSLFLLQNLYFNFLSIIYLFLSKYNLSILGIYFIFY